MDSLTLTLLHSFFKGNVLTQRRETYVKQQNRNRQMKYGSRPSNLAPGGMRTFLPSKLAATQAGIETLMARGFHNPGYVENRVGYYIGKMARS